jgi:hypothetical protein
MVSEEVDGFDFLVAWRRAALGLGCPDLTEVKSY